MKTQMLPKKVTKYFWGDNIQDLSWNTHRNYIIQTILEKGDRDAVSWMFQKLSKKEIHNMPPSLNLSKKSSHFWNIYLS